MSEPTTQPWRNPEEIANDNMAEAIQENEDRWDFINSLFSANYRNKFKNDIILPLFTVEDANETALAIGEISHPDYYRNRTALNKLIF